MHVIKKKQNKHCCSFLDLDTKLKTKPFVRLVSCPDVCHEFARRGAYLRHAAFILVALVQRWRVVDLAGLGLEPSHFH